MTELVSIPLAPDDVTAILAQAQLRGGRPAPHAWDSVGLSVEHLPPVSFFKRAQEEPGPAFRSIQVSPMPPIGLADVLRVVEATKATGAAVSATSSDSPVASGSPSALALRLGLQKLGAASFPFLALKVSYSDGQASAPERVNAFRRFLNAIGAAADVRVDVSQSKPVVAPSSRRAVAKRGLSPEAQAAALMEGQVLYDDRDPWGGCAGGDLCVLQVYLPRSAELEEHARACAREMGVPEHPWSLWISSEVDTYEGARPSLNALKLGPWRVDVVAPQRYSAANVEAALAEADGFALRAFRLEDSEVGALEGVVFVEEDGGGLRMSFEHHQPAGKQEVSYQHVRGFINELAGGRDIIDPHAA